MTMHHHETPWNYKLQQTRENDLINLCQCSQIKEHAPLLINKLTFVMDFISLRILAKVRSRLDI